MKNVLLNVLSCLIVLMFGTNYIVAEYFAPWDIDPDKNLALRFNLYAVIIMGAFILTQFDLNKWGRFILTIGLGFCTSDVIDRLIFDIKTFQANDIIMIILTILTAYYKHIYVRKGSTNAK